MNANNLLTDLQRVADKHNLIMEGPEFEVPSIKCEELFSRSFKTGGRLAGGGDALTNVFKPVVTERIRISVNFTCDERIVIDHERLEKA